MLRRRNFCDRPMRPNRVEHSRKHNDEIRDTGSEAVEEGEDEIFVVVKTDRVVELWKDKKASAKEQ